ncbi:MAG: beta-ketoacyl-ACP synthase II [Chloroflexota bacterium]
MKRVVVTGVGAVTSLGQSWNETWCGLAHGRSGVNEITLFDAADLPVRIAAEVKNWDPAVLERRDVRHLDRSVQFALLAAREAVKHADLRGARPDRFGVILASATGGLELIQRQHQAFLSGGYRKVSAHLLPNMLPDSAAAHLAMEHDARGPNMAVVSACATGSNSIGEAAQMIRRGDADVMLAGGTEAPVNPLFIAAFGGMRALAPPDRNGPEGACKPFDLRRKGLVVGEGAAVLVLESEEHAKARGAEWLAELAGYGTSCDAHHLAAPHPNAEGMIAAMRLALDSAGLVVDDVDYISAHGTGTPLNDRLETLAIKQVLGEHAAGTPVSSIKGAVGHLMAGSGALEAAVSVQALMDGLLPPTLNLEEPDPECDLDYVPLQARRAALRVILSNSFGMGGHNASLVFRKP